MPRPPRDTQYYRSIDDGKSGLLEENTTWSINDEETVWRRPPYPPDEPFENRDYEWKVLSEEIGYAGRRVYELGWPDWQRKDGTSNTFDPVWIFADSGVGRDIKKWSKQRHRERKEKVKAERLVMSPQIWSDPNEIHTVETMEMAAGLEEKVIAAKRTPWADQGESTTEWWKVVSPPVSRSPSPNAVEEDEEDELLLQPPPRIIRPPNPSARLARPSDNPPSSSSWRITTRSTSSSSKRPLQSGTMPPPKKSRRMPSHTPSEESEAQSVTLVGRRSSSSRMDIDEDGSRRYTAKEKGKGRMTTAQELTESWTAKAQRSNAPPITLMPRQPGNYPFKSEAEAHDFEYLECRYPEHVYESDLKAPLGMYTHCTCLTPCRDPIQCDCQDESLVGPEDTRGVFAYTKDGRFAFHKSPRDTLVIECNDNCTCHHKCPNRVSQRGRRVPIIIFETGTERGWGVKSTHSTRKGEILGLYVGNIITRAAANKLSVEEGMYCFDVDSTGDPNISSKPMTVDSRSAGNWTRFINHSCAPNLAVVRVRYDLLYPYIAVICLKDIPAETEFTLDYDPAFAEALLKEPNRPHKGRVKCFCRSKDCRKAVFGYHKP